MTGTDSECIERGEIWAGVRILESRRERRCATKDWNRSVHGDIEGEVDYEGKKSRSGVWVQGSRTSALYWKMSVNIPSADFILCSVRFSKFLLQRSFGTSYSVPISPEKSATFTWPHKVFGNSEFVFRFVFSNSCTFGYAPSVIPDAYSADKVSIKGVSFILRLGWVGDGELLCWKEVEVLVEEKGK